MTQDETDKIADLIDKIEDKTKAALKKRVHLVSFVDGSYKKIVEPKFWSQSVWLHYTKRNGSVVRINLRNVNYIEEMDE